MLRVLFFFLLLLTGCNTCRDPYLEMYRYVRPCYKVPRVMILPIFNSTSQNVDWNVADEIDEEIRDQIFENNSLYLVHQDETILRNFYVHDFSLEETCWKVHGICSKIDYVVLVDIVKHEVVPNERLSLEEDEQTNTLHSCASVLLMKARLTIMDMRGDSPAILVQEMISSNQLIPKEYEFWNYKKHGWGSCSYTDSPMDKAHRRLADVIVRRLENIACNAP
jgi:hypothetical protein